MVELMTQQPFYQNTRAKLAQAQPNPPITLLAQTALSWMRQSFEELAPSESSRLNFSTLITLVHLSVSSSIYSSASER